MKVYVSIFERDSVLGVYESLNAAQRAFKLSKEDQLGGEGWRNTSKDDGSRSIWEFRSGIRHDYMRHIEVHNLTGVQAIQRKR